MEYSEKIIAFIDILGFRDYIEKSKKDIKVLNNAYTTLLFMKDLHYQRNMITQARNVSQFSDLIVISYSVDRNCMNWLLDDVFYLFKTLLNSGLLMRGVILKGQIIHYDSIIMGPALVDAYDIERRRVVNPRIIIDKSVSKYLPSNDLFNLPLDDDGEQYINFFHNVSKSGHDYKHLNKKLNDVISKGIKNDDASISAKYLWMKKKKESYSLISSH